MSGICSASLCQLLLRICLAKVQGLKDKLVEAEALSLICCTASVTCGSFQVSESVEAQAQNVASAGAVQQHLQELESLRLEAAKASGTIQLIR